MFAAGCASASRASNVSAGGQLEQPSEVKSSITTGVRCVSCGIAEACTSWTRGRIKAAAATRVREIRVKPANSCFIENILNLPPQSDFVARKRLPRGRNSGGLSSDNRHDNFHWSISSRWFRFGADDVQCYLIASAAGRAPLG